MWTKINSWLNPQQKLSPQKERTKNIVDLFIESEIEITRDSKDKLWFGKKNDNRPNRVMSKLTNFLKTHKNVTQLRLIKELFEEKVEEKGGTLKKFQGKQKKPTIYLGIRFKKNETSIDKIALNLTEIENRLTEIENQTAKITKKLTETL